MKKQIKHMLIMLSVIFISSMFGSVFSASAIFQYATPEEEQYLIDNCIEITDEEAISTKEIPKRVFLEENKRHIMDNIMFNYTRITVDDGIDQMTLLTTYEKYEAALGFDAVKKNYLYNGKYCLTMYDYLDADGNASYDSANFTDKTETVSAMIKELQTAGVTLYDASYEQRHATLSTGWYQGYVIFQPESEEQLSEIRDFAASYSEFTEPEYLGYIGDRKYIGIADYNTARTICKEVKAKYQISIEPEMFYPDTEETISIGKKDFTPTVGDVNLDGKIALDDTILIKKYEAGAVTLEEAQKANADLDGNGAVDSSDALQLLRFLLRLEEAIG